MKYLVVPLALLCGGAWAVEPPAGTVTALDNVGHFDGSQNLLDSCVALLNADGTAQLDADGKPRVYSILLGLDRPSLTFTLLSALPFDTSAGMDCSGVFKAGVYTDATLITNLGGAYNGGVWNLTLDYVPGSNLEFRLRLDSSFSAVRNLGANTTELGSELGDFAQNTTREYGNASLPASIALKLPQCSDPQGDQARVMLVKDGVLFGSFTPGTTFPWPATTLAVGEYTFQAYCSDEMAVRTLATAAGLPWLPAYAAVTASAAGTLRIKVVEGTASTPTPVEGEITFNFAASTSAADQDLIRASVLYARDFLQSTFGRTLQKNTTITTLGQTGGCSNPGASAFAGGQSLTLCTGNQGWSIHGEVVKRKILIHEVFHLLQFEQRWLGGPPGSITGAHWLIEGAAEYVGWLGVAARGDLGFDTAHGCMLKEVADFAQRQPPGLPNLSALETQQSFGGGPVYPLAMIGTKQLIDGSSLAKVLDYGDALAGGTAWATAFAAAFGTTSTQFYAQFPAYKDGLAVPAEYACRI